MKARTDSSGRERLVVLLAGMLALLVAVPVAPATAQQSQLRICLEVTNDADGDGSFTPSETAVTDDDVTHRVTIEDCGDWDVTVASVVATTDDGDEAVCASLSGELLRVDETTSCDFDLPAPDDEATTSVTVTVMDASGDLGATQATGETTVTRGTAPAPAPTSTTTPTSEPSEEPTTEPSSEPTEDATEEVADDELADTGAGSWALLAWGLLLVMAGATVHDAGRRAHVLQPAVALHARHRGEHNPLLAGAMAVSRQLRWALEDWHRTRR